MDLQLAPIGSVLSGSAAVAGSGRAAAGSVMREPGQGRSGRGVRRAVRARVPGAGVRGVATEFREAWADPGSAGSSTSCSRSTPGRPDPAHPGPQPLRRARHHPAAQAGGPGAHRLATRSTTCSGRRCWPGGWASTRLIAETGAGQHGVATATAAALLGMRATVYMGERDIERQQLNVFRMEMLGAEVVPVTSGSRTLKDATNEAMRAWVADVDDAHFLLGSVGGPAPVPVDGPGVPAGDRRRGAGAQSAGACPTWWWPASAAARTRPARSPASSTRRPG